MLLGFALEASGGAPLGTQFKDLCGSEDRGEPLLYCRPRIFWTASRPRVSTSGAGGCSAVRFMTRNAAALGGVAAHAGLFGTAAAVGSFARLVLRTFSEPTQLAHARSDEAIQFEDGSGWEFTSSRLGHRASQRRRREGG
jgi:hypothetical protein